MNNTSTQIETPIILSNGKEVYSYEYIERLRAENSDYNIIAQKGSQELFLLCQTDICIFGGKRGGSKSFSLLMESLKDIYNPNFSALVFRKEKNDTSKSGGLAMKSNQLYKPFGTYNKSKDDMTWNFYSGGQLKFDYYSDSYNDFVEREQGLELTYMGVDEITHMQYEYFKYLITSNRNAHKMKSRFRGTCNPDPDSWVASFIGGTFSDSNGNIKYKWINEDGDPIKEMNGKILYCCMYGERVDEIYWGETREDVYIQNKDEIDRLWNSLPTLHKFGNKLDMLLYSVTFIEGKLEENIKLLESDPGYIKSLFNQSKERQARDLHGNWKFKSSGDGLISRDHLEAMFKNSHQKGEFRCVTCDVALDGGDKCVLWYWVGFHVMDIEVCTVDSKITLNTIKSFLDKHQIHESNFTYDANGIGKYIEGFMPNAMPFYNNQAPTESNRLKYDNLKSECADKCADRIKDLGYSLDGLLLGRKFNGKMLIDILREEYKCLRRDNKQLDGKFKIIAKADAKKIIGHSPDFFESFFMREYFTICEKQVIEEGFELW